MATYFWVGGTGTWDAANTANWSATSGGAGGAGVPNSTDTVIFDSSSGTGTCTTASGSACAIATLNSSTLGLTLGANHTMSGLFTLTAGTLSLGANTLSIGLFTSNNANTRAINFGTGAIAVTGFNNNIWLAQNATNLTLSGSRTVNCTYAGSVGTRAIYHALSAGGSANTALDFFISAGTDATDIGGSIRTLDFTGYSGTTTNRTKILYGDLVFSSGMTLTAGGDGITTLAASGTQKITTNGKTIDFALVFINAGATVQLQDNCTVGATRSVTLVSGTLDLNGRTLTVGSFVSSNSNVRNIQFGSGSTLVVTGSGATAFNATTGTNLTTSGTGVISMTSASAKTFVGGGRSYPTLNQGGAGALTITGANTFANITNTVQPATITFPASTTTTVSAFSVSGTSGNLITINSSTPGTRATLSDASGVVSVSFCNIQDSNATGGAIWNSLTSAGNVDAGNNLNWNFSVTPQTVTEVTYALRSFTQPRRF